MNADHYSWIMSRHFRDELCEIPDLVERAKRLIEIETEVDTELRQVRLRLARDMAAKGMTMAQIGAAFGVTRARAHQMVHQRASGRAPKTLAV